MNAFDYAASLTWAIQREHLQIILDCAARVDNSPDAAAERIAGALEKRDERESNPASLATRAGDKVPGTRSVIMRDDAPGVAIISVVGPIFRYANLFSMYSGGTSTDILARDMRFVIDNPGFKAILLNIDSPGGEAFGINELANIISAGAAKKPITAYVSGMSASGAYWIASAADEIVIDDLANLGSIGVVMAVQDSAKRNEERGVYEFVSSQSPNKRPKPGTESGNSRFQQRVDDMAAVFISAVAANRGVAEEKVLSEFGAGDVLVGKRAVDVGLADRIGSFEAVLSEMAVGKRKKKMSAAAATDNTQPEAGDNSGGYDMSDKKEKGFFARLFSGMSAEEKQEAAQLLAGEDGKQTTATAAPVAKTEPPQNAEKPPSVAQGAPPAQQGESEETKTLRAQVAALQESNYRSEALAFIQPLIVAGKAMPAESDDFVKDYVQRAKDDAANPLASGPRVDSLKAVYNNRPAHQLTREQLKAKMSGATVLPDSDDPEAKAIEEDRKAARAYAEKANPKTKAG